MQETIIKIRRFNRFYMPSMHLLGDHYLGSEYSITWARVFFELYENEGCNAAHIAQLMNIDKSYLSRILKGHEKNGYIRRERSTEDSRSYRLYLTDAGKARAEDFIQRSNQEIGAVIQHLTAEEERQLTAALETVTTLLEKGEHHEDRTV